MPRLAFLPIALFAVWCFVCHQWYVCHIKQKCDAQTEQPPPPPPSDTAADNRPLVFKWSDANAITRSNFEVYRDSILKALPAGSLLEITGFYSKDEPAPQGFANMGLARGEQVKALFAKFIPAERIVVSSELVPEPPDARTKPFESIRFGQRTAEPPPSTVECVANKDNSLTILFPYGKAQREVDLQIEKCLEDIVTHLNKTDDKVQITGHTDSAGSAEFNQQLGLLRAQHLQGILIKKGIPKSRVIAASKGESEPVASNDTEEGSRLNRRATLVLQKTKPAQ